MTPHKHSPLITVGITCFNAAQSIQRAISSALNQDWTNLEVVVVDDGSEDDSVNIIRKLSATDPRIRVFIHSHNQGCASARNTIVHNAKGEFLAFFDDDDVSRPDRLTLQYQRLTGYERNQPNVLTVCFASGQRTYPNGYSLPLEAVGSQGAEPIGEQIVDYLLFNQRLPGVFYGSGTPTCSMMTRTETLRKIGAFDEQIQRQEDVDLAIRLGFAQGHFIGITDPVLQQFATIRANKASHVEHNSFLTILTKNKDYLEKKGVYGYMKLWSALRYRHFAGQHIRATLVLGCLFITHPVRTFGHFIRSASHRFRHEKRMKA